MKVYAYCLDFLFSLQGVQKISWTDYCEYLEADSY